jgi:DNA-binding protein HU-beta
VRASRPARLRASSTPRFDAIAGELAAGRDIAIAGFGKFSVTERAAREGRNPATGETIQIAASRAAKFSAAAALKQQLNS